MTFAVSPGSDDIFAALRGFIADVVPVQAANIIQAQVNRVPEPTASDFVVMTLIRQTPIEFPLDSYQDVSFDGSIADEVLTVTEVNFGSIVIGMVLFGVDVALNTVILSQESGTPGGAGSYTVSVEQTLSERAFASGGKSILQPTMVDIQLDIHGPSSANNAQIFNTMFFNGYGVDKFGELNSNIVPLFCTDPQQIPFVNGEQQYEDRMVLQVMLQANQSVTKIPLQFAGELEADVISVEAEYPAA